MCWRLAAALDGALPEAEALGAAAGLDVTANGKVLDVAWGDCACSLRTKDEGRRRLGAFVRALLDHGARVQLVLVEQGVPLALAGEIEMLPVELLEADGLAALPEGRVVEIA